MSSVYLDVVSPQSGTSTATQASGTNRGGRPRVWTDARTRRLTRLYLYTPLKLQEILEVIKEDLWVPGKEAANKVLNDVLGKDPRWMRPKDFDEQRKMVESLRQSSRPRRRGESAPQPMTEGFSPFDATCHRADTNTLASKNLGPSSSCFVDTAEGAASVWTASQHQHMDSDMSYGLVPHDNLGTLGTFSNSSRQKLNRIFTRRFTRQGTSMTASTDYTTGSFRTREAFSTVQVKLSKVAISDVKDIFRLLKRFTFSDADDEMANTSSPSYHSTSQRGFSDSTGIQRQFADVTAAPPLAIDVMDASTFWECTTCASGKSSHQTVVYTCYRPHSNDNFGNTPYHYFASTPGLEQKLNDAILYAMNDSKAPVDAQNTSRQTFIHVLHDSWFLQGSQLEDLLAVLRKTKFDFYAVDLYGRNAFHVFAHHLSRDRGRLQNIASQFDWKQLNRRDAFGNKPMIMRRVGTMSVVQNERPTLTIPKRQTQTLRNAKLLELMNNSLKGQPDIEDPSTGYNALHCLAQVVLDLEVLPDVEGVPCTRRNKRRLDEKGEAVEESSHLSYRLTCLETLLEAGVDVNHYNASGDTVLMAFITHISDGKEDKDLEHIIKTLLKAGANLEARNRAGETVLHVAARLGQKFAVKVLLQQGANMHARNGQELGVLQVIDILYATTEDDKNFNARLEACRAMLTGRFGRFDAVQFPTAEQEWNIRERTTLESPSTTSPTSNTRVRHR